ncbi:MAG: hypothetical protein JW876_07275 [Candidatus Krumholzibacteriota bacterium]|nr:hypothetical protein [Candidatus Krumholzibacteriota bacterium]
MAALKPKFDHYQDVRTNLANWSVPFWAVCVFVSWQYVLTPEHRYFIAMLVPGTVEWVRILGKFAAAVAVGGIMSVVLVHLLEIHDHLYDHYIVRWRRHYDSEFIMPALLAPYSGRVPERTIELARSDAKDFMWLHFYQFVGDRHTKISTNLVVRFYERVTKYWLFQLAEVATLLLILASAIYWLLVIIFTDTGITGSVLWVWGLSVVAFAVSRMIGRGLRSPLTRATQAEINAVHSTCKAEFEEALSGFLVKHGEELADA